VKKSLSKKATYYLIPTIQHSGKSKTMKRIKISVRGREKGGMSSKAQRISKHSENS